MTLDEFNALEPGLYLIQLKGGISILEGLVSIARNLRSDFNTLICPQWRNNVSAIGSADYEEIIDEIDTMIKIDTTAYLQMPLDLAYLQRLYDDLSEEKGKLTYFIRVFPTPAPNEEPNEYVLKGYDIGSVEDFEMGRDLANRYMGSKQYSKVVILSRVQNELLTIWPPKEPQQLPEAMRKPQVSEEELESLTLEDDQEPEGE